jgi:hypothetical protein
VAVWLAFLVTSLVKAPSARPLIAPCGRNLDPETDLALDPFLFFALTGSPVLSGVGVDPGTISIFILGFLRDSLYHNFLLCQEKLFTYALFVMLRNKLKES